MSRGLETRPEEENRWVIQRDSTKCTNELQTQLNSLRIRLSGVMTILGQDVKYLVHHSDITGPQTGWGNGQHYSTLGKKCLSQEERTS